MHFPLSLVDDFLDHISGLFSVIAKFRRKNLFSLGLILTFAVFSAIPAQAKNFSVYNDNRSSSSCSLGNATFGNQGLQDAIDCAVFSYATQADVILIQGGAYSAAMWDSKLGTSVYNRTEPYVGAYGIPWNPDGDNDLVTFEGVKSNWVPISALVNYQTIYSTAWWDYNIPVRLHNPDREIYPGMPLIANLSVGFTVTGSNVAYGVPVSIANIQFEGENIGVFIKGDSTADGFHTSGATSSVVNCRITGYGCGEYCNPSTLTKYGHGIALYGGSKAVVCNNELSSNYDGLAVADNGTDAIIQGNYVFYNKRNGIGVRNNAAPLIGDTNLTSNFNLRYTNKIYANYIGIGCRDNSQPTIAKNIIDGRMSFAAIQLRSYGLRGTPPYNKFGIAARDYSSPTIWGNRIVHNKWGGITNMDFTTPIIGHSNYGQNTVRNIIQHNSKAFDLSDTTQNCNIRAEVEGRAAIGSKDAAKPIIRHNSISLNKWAGIGNKDWAAASITNNLISNNPTGIVLSNTMTTEPGSSVIYSNIVIRSSDVGIAVRDSGNAVYRVLIYENRIQGVANRPSSGIGVNHSYVSIYNNTVYDAGNSAGGSLLQKSAAIGIRNGSDAIITGNRIMENGLGIVVLGSRVRIENNLITDNWGTAEALGVWISDGSIGDKVNHNLIVGNQFIANRFKGTGIKVSNNSLLREARYNIIHNYTDGIKTFYTSDGSIEEGAVDYNLVTQEVYDGSSKFDTFSPEEAGYELYFWDTTIETYIRDYPGPNTHYFGSRYGGVSNTTIFSNPGTSGNGNRDFSLRTNASLYNLANSTLYSMGLTSDYDFANLPLDFNDINISFNKTFPGNYNYDVTSPTFTNNTDVRMVKSSPEPNSTNASDETDIVVYIRDTGDGIKGSTITVEVTDDGGAVSGSTSYEPDWTDDAMYSTSSWYKVTFAPDSAMSIVSSVFVTVTAADELGSSFGAGNSYSFAVTSSDVTAPTIGSREPDDLDIDVDKNPHIRFHIKDTAGVSIGNTLITVTATPAGPGGTPQAVTTILSNYDVIDNTDPTDLIVTYIPTDNYEYESTVTVEVTTTDFDNNKLNKDSYDFTIMKDNFAPEDAQAFHAEPAGTNGVFLSWLSSVDSEGDLTDQIISFCDNWNEETQKHECYGRNGTNAWNWQYWRGVGSVVDSALVDGLPEGRYLFMLEVEDERAESTHPDKSESFDSDVIGDGTWEYSDSITYSRVGSAGFVVNTTDNVLEGYASTDPDSTGEAQLILADYAPGNLYFKYRFSLRGNYHGAYNILRHNVGEQNSMGGLLGTSGFLVYVTSSEVGIKIMPDPITALEGCDICGANSSLGSTAVSVSSNVWYEVRIAVYNGNIRVEVWDLATPADKTSDPNTIIGTVTTSDALRYKYGEIGFYTPSKEIASASCGNVPTANRVLYDDVEIEWYGILADDYIYVRGGYFNDDFTGFEDDFAGNLAQWTVNGKAAWDLSAVDLISDGIDGELISFGFVPKNDFKASAVVTINNAQDNAYLLFRRQYRRGVGESGYLAALENNGTGSEVGFYKITSSGLERLSPDTWLADEISDTNIYTVTLTVTGSSFSLKVEGSASTATASDSTYTGGMVGLYRGSSAVDSMSYDDYQLNDMLTNDWITTTGTPSWEVSITEGTLSGSFAMRAISGSADSEAVVNDLILYNNFMFEGDMLLSDVTGKAAAFYFQKQPGSQAGRDAYGLMLQIDPNGYPAGQNTYFFKLDSAGTKSTLKNGSTGADSLGGFDIATDSVVHVRILASAVSFPSDSGIYTDGVGYSFAAYMSTTPSKPYTYEYVVAAQHTGNMTLANNSHGVATISNSDAYLDGQAGFYLPGAAFSETPASVVNVDNVIIGRMEDFAIPRAEAGSTEVAIADPTSFGSENAIYQDINNSIKDIENSVSNGDIPCGGKYIQLLSGLYTIGNNTLNMGECVAIRGNGRDNTTIQGRRKSVISFSQNSHGSSIQDLTVTADNDPKNNACIWIIDDSPLIKNVQVEKCWDGIRIGGGLHDPVNHPARPTITASRIIYNTHIGIGNNVASDAWIVNNRIFANQYNGIGVLDIAAPRIENNIIGSSAEGVGGWSEGNGNMGIGVWDNSAPSIIGNSISVNNVGGIGIRGNAIPNILYNTIASNNYGIMAYEWSEPLIYYNIIRNNFSFGNAAQDSVIWEIRYNEIFGNPTGIAMMEDATGLVEGNYIYSNSQSSPAFIEAGIRVRGGVDTSIYNNWVVDNDMKGIAFMDIPSTANILVRYNYIARNASQSGTTGNFGLSITGSELGSASMGYIINYGNFLIDKNVILNNYDGGVGFKDFGGTVTFEDNIVASNTVQSTGIGGGISFLSPTDANINLSTNSFFNNQGDRAGGIGVSFGNSGTTVSVVNNAVYWNTSTNVGYANGGIGFLDSSSELYISGNVVHSNRSSVTHAGIAVRWEGTAPDSTSGPIQILNNTVYSHRDSEAAIAGAGADTAGLLGKAGIGVRNVTFDNATGYLTISGNTVSNNTTGIRVRGDNPSGSSTGAVSISNNVINSSRLNGILVHANGIESPVSIIGNNLDNSGIISNGGRAGIRVREVGEDVVIRNNSVFRFGKSGIRCRSISNSRTTYILNNTIGNIYETGIGINSILGSSSPSGSGTVSISNNLIYSSSNPNITHGLDPDDGGISISTFGNNANIWLLENTIRNNTAAEGVGGLGFFEETYSAIGTANINLDANVIWGNIGSSGGGIGFTNVNAIVSITNNSIYNNASISTIRGVGGIGFMESGGTVIIDSNVIYSNTTANTQPD